MSETKLAWPHSTCAECGKKIPAGQQQRCEKGGLCDWHIPAAVLALLTDLTNTPALTPKQAAAGELFEALVGMIDRFSYIEGTQDGHLLTAARDALAKAGKP